MFVPRQFFYLKNIAVLKLEKSSDMLYQDKNHRFDNFSNVMIYFLIDIYHI